MVKLYLLQNRHRQRQREEALVGCVLVPLLDFLPPMRAVLMVVVVVVPELYGVIYRVGSDL